VLKALTIQDLAVVRHLDLEFNPGLTVITGETGAGKSIVVDALGLVLGDRAETAMVRAGAERAVVVATFDTRDRPDLAALFAAHALDDGAECLLRRVLGNDGRSRAFCNATPVTLPVLREVAASLVDIHGQHEHHSLLRRPVQRELLDAFGRLDAPRAVVRASHAAWAESARALRAAQETGDPAARADYLRFQLAELEEVLAEAADLEVLKAAHRRAAHQQRLRDSSTDAARRLFAGERPPLRLLTQTVGALRELTGVDAGLLPVVDLLDQAAINLGEAEHELTRYLERLDREDPVRLAELERRLGRLHDLARKHRCEPTALPALHAACADELAGLESLDARRAALLRAEVETRLACARAADALGVARRATAGPMAGEISRIMRELGMPDAVFDVALDVLPEPGPDGSEEVEFMMTTNPDLPPRALRKVASGGELSRTSLAIQVATASGVRVPTLVYDEIDTGIGGRTALAVARHLRAIAQGRQVLCVTHLAQIASAGDHHLTIIKDTDSGATRTRALYLDARERVEEVARMLGGNEGSLRARAHARELLGGS
jgi:DNA repair protein RecN (Recombination protein N)